MYNSKRLIILFVFAILLSGLFSGCGQSDIIPDQGGDANISNPPLQDDLPANANNSIEEVKDNLFFFKDNVLQMSYDGSFLFEDDVKKEVKLNIVELVNLKNGKLYELRLQDVEGVPDERLSFGYFYVEKDKIYKMEPAKENIDVLKAGEELPNGSVVVCQDEEIKDSLEKDEPGWHYYLEISGDRREYHAYNNQVSSGYYESFIWEKNKGLIGYRSGYGAERDSIELQLKDNMEESKLDTSTVESYGELLKSFPVGLNYCKYVGIAYKEFASRASEDKSINDMMFKEFYDFYYQFEGVGAYDIDREDPVLKENGFQVIGYEEGPYIFCEPDYLKNNFTDYVSDKLKDFIIVDRKDKMLGGYIITDALLCIERDELSDIIIEWENYLKKYPDPDWTTEMAKNKIRGYMLVYASVDLESFSDMRGETKREEDILRSYKRFMEKYPDSKYYQFIKEYYQLLKNEGVKETENGKKLLKKFGLID